MFLAHLMLWGGLFLMTQTLADEPPVELHRMLYSGVDAGLTFTEVEHPAEDWQPWAPTEVEQASGFIPFTRPETYDIRPWSRPRENERVRELTCFLAKGETTGVWFAVYALEPLQRVQVEVAGSPDGITVSPYYAHFWAQRYDWKGGRYYVIPELLLQMEGGRAQFPAAGGVLEWRNLNVPQAETCLFWLRVTASQDVTDGQYTVVVVIRSQQKQPVRLPLRVTVYPFRLQKPPDKRWLMYSDSYLLGQMSDEQLLAVLKHMQDYGIDGLTELPIGEIDISALAQGVVRYHPEPLLRWHRLLQQAGLRGPHTIGTFIEEQVVAQLGIQADLNREWPQPLREAMQNIGRTVVKTLEPHGIDWLFYAWDEPTADNVRAIEQYRNWREGGARTYVTVARDAYLAAARWLTHPCFATDVINLPNGAEWARRQCRRRQQQFYWYGSGCYLFQEGRMLPNRYLAGWLFWKTKADGQVSWTFLRPHLDPFNDPCHHRLHHLLPGLWSYLPPFYQFHQRVVGDGERQVHPPTSSHRLIAGEDNLGGVERVAGAQLGLAPFAQGSNDVRNRTLDEARTVHILVTAIDSLPFAPSEAAVAQRWRARLHAAQFNNSFAADNAVMCAHEACTNARGCHAPNAVAVLPLGKRLILVVRAKDKVLRAVVYLGDDPLRQSLVIEVVAHVEVMCAIVIQVTRPELHTDQPPDHAFVQQLFRHAEGFAKTPLVVEGQPHATPFALLRHQPCRAPRVVHRLLAVDGFHSRYRAVDHQLGVRHRPRADAHDVQLFFLQHLPVAGVDPGDTVGGSKSTRVLFHDVRTRHQFAIGNQLVGVCMGIRHSETHGTSTLRFTPRANESHSKLRHVYPPSRRVVSEHEGWLSKEIVPVLFAR